VCNLICLLKVVDEDQRRRDACLRQHSFFQLRVHLKRGKDLVAKDTGGEHWRKAFLSVFITTLEPLFSLRLAVINFDFPLQPHAFKQSRRIQLFPSHTHTRAKLISNYSL
jgi:hypothetical protein